MFLPWHSTVATDYWNLQESLKAAQRSTFLSQLIFCPKIRGQKLNSEFFFPNYCLLFHCSHVMWSIHLSIHHYQSFLVMCQRLLLAAMKISPTLKATNSQNRQPKVGRACSVLITKLKKQIGRSKNLLYLQTNAEEFHHEAAGGCRYSGRTIRKQQHSSQKCLLSSPTKRKTHTTCTSNHKLPCFCTDSTTTRCRGCSLVDLHPSQTWQIVPQHLCLSNKSFEFLHFSFLLYALYLVFTFARRSSGHL